MDIEGSVAERFSDVPERRARTLRMPEQTAATAGAVARICNDETGCPDVQYGDGCTHLSLSVYERPPRAGLARRTVTAGCRTPAGRSGAVRLQRLRQRLSSRCKFSASHWKRSLGLTTSNRAGPSGENRNFVIVADDDLCHAALSGHDGRPAEFGHRFIRPGRVRCPPASTRRSAR